MASRKFRFLFSVFLLLLLSSCSSKDELIHHSPKHISICVLGNSYSNDSFSYVPFILGKYGITCSIHIYYRGSGSLCDLDREWLSGNGNTKHFYIDTRVDRKWKSENGITARDILSIEDWDIVSLQQSSLQVSNENSYHPYLENVVDSLRHYCSKPFVLAWFMAYNRPNDDAKSRNLTVQKRIIEEYPFGLVFPVATAIFDCQTHPSFSDMGDSKYGLMFSGDNVHLQEGLPCYAAALTITESLLRYYSPENCVIGNSIRPSQEWINMIGGITPNGYSIGVSESNCLLAQKAAVVANNNMFEIITIE